MPLAIMLREYGGPEVLRMEPVEVPSPGPGEIRLRQTAIGVNFHDCYVRSGLYRTLALPGVPGIEAAGVVEAVGPGVTGFAPGDRVGYVTGGYGAYASHRVLPAALALRPRRSRRFCGCRRRTGGGRIGRSGRGRWRAYWRGFRIRPRASR